MKERVPKTPRVLEVTWRDSVSSKGPWMTLDEAKQWARDKILLKTVGYAFHEDEDELVLAASYSAGGGIGGLWAIPKAAIVKRRVLK